MLEEKTRRLARPARRSRMSAQNHKLTSNKLEILITIVNRNKADFYIDLIQSHDVNMQFSTAARGTADIAILNRLGITDTDKAVIFSIIKEENRTEILSLLDEKFRTIKNGNGIAYTIPMSSIVGTGAFLFLSNQRQGGLFDGQ
jgi:hypothetical protein